jgi:hypothetical protein
MHAESSFQLHTPAGAPGHAQAYSGTLRVAWHGSRCQRMVQGLCSLRTWKDYNAREDASATDPCPVIQVSAHARGYRGPLSHVTRWIFLRAHYDRSHIKVARGGPSQRVFQLRIVQTRSRPRG